MKVITALLAIMGVFFLASCVGFSNTNSLTIAFSMHSEDTAVRAVKRELQAHVAQGLIKKVTLHNAVQNTQAQLSKVRSLLDTKSIDALVIQSPDTNLIKHAYDFMKTTNTSTPIIFLVSDESVFENALVYVPAYEKIGCVIMFGAEAGRAQAQFVKAALRGSGSVGLLVGKLGSAPQVRRTRGFEQGLRNTNVVISHQESANSRSIAALKIVKTWLHNKTHGIDAIVANDDSMALGAALGLQELGMRKRVLIVGGGTSEEGLAGVKTGELDMTLKPNASVIVREILRMARSMAQSEFWQREIAVPPLVVTR